MQIRFYLEPKANQDSHGYPTIKVKYVPEEEAKAVAKQFANSPSGTIHEEYEPVGGGQKEAFTIQADQVVMISVTEDKESPSF
jgi:hypothetical protein